jgi:uncharacterized protein
VQLAEDAWNTRDPDRVVLAYTEDSQWRNRDESLGAVTRSEPSSSATGSASSTTAEHWEVDEQSGLMRRRDASINDHRIESTERRLALDDAGSRVAPR